MNYSALLGALASMMGIVVVWGILTIIAFWKVFAKAGESGWKSLIPYYNAYILFKISWKPVMFWAYLALSVVLMLTTASVPVLAGLCSVALFVLYVIAMIQLAKSFGKGVGFGVGLILLNTIFIMILAFGSAKYVGPNGGNSVSAEPAATV